MSILRPGSADEQRHSRSALTPALLLSLVLHTAAGSLLLVLARPQEDPPQGPAALTVRIARTAARGADSRLSPTRPPSLESAASSLLQDLASLAPPPLAAIPQVSARLAVSPRRQVPRGSPHKARPGSSARHTQPKPVKPRPVKLISAPPTKRTELARTSLSTAAGPEAPAQPQFSAHEAGIGQSPAPFIGAHYDADYLHNPAPEYPLMARRLGLQGMARLKVLVSAQGLAQEVRLSESSGSEVLDRAAVESVRHWRFVPARRGDRALESWVEVPVRFVLR